MPAVRPDAVLRFIRQLAVREQFARLPDAKLLDRFVSTRDEEAFAALVRRHGPMVLRVCLQVLDHEHDAQDAFQATFLVLSRKAAAVKKRQSVGSWLFGVANHAALDLKRKRARRRSRESQAGQRPVTDPLSALTLQEAQTILNQELARLAEKYRAPLVLCSLEGLTRDEAAQQLGLTVGTLKNRLEQARHRLRVRLTARGLSLSAAFVASVFGEQMVSAAMPAALLASTVQAAISLGAGSTAASLVSAQVAALSEGVLKAMSMNQIKIATILLLAGGLLAAGSGALTLGSHAGQQTDARPIAGKDTRMAPEVDTKDEKPLDAPKPVAKEKQSKASWKPEARFQVGPAAVLSIAFTADSNYMVAGCDDGNVKVWQVPTGEELSTLKSEKSQVSSVAISPVNRNLLATGGRKFEKREERGDGEVKLWHLPTATEKAAFKGLVPPIYALAFAPGGRSLAAADANAVKLWDVSSNNENRTYELKDKIAFELNGMQMNSVAFSPEGRTLAAGGFQKAPRTPGVVKLWDVQSKNEVATLRNDLGGSVYAVAFSPDGRTLAVASELDVILWDVTKDKATKKASFRVLEGNRPARPIYSLAFSPDGKMLAVGWEQVKLLDAAILQERATLEVKASGSTRVAFAPDGKRLAVAGYLRGDGGGGFVQWWTLAEKESGSAPGAGDHRPVLKDENNPSPLRLSASGKVVDTQGKPIHRATVYLREMALLRDPNELQKNNYTDILSETKTDAAGQFAFQNILAEPMKISPSNIHRYPWSIAVVSKGYGLGWHDFKSPNENNLRIVLSPEARLRGRLLDANGKPAAGVRVQLTQIDEQIDPDLGNRFFSIDRLPVYLYWSKLPLGTLTDTEGRFTFDGLPNGFHIGLLASDPRFARKWLSCATVDQAEIERFNDNPSVPAASKLLADGFSATLQPSGRIQGQVIYKDTGKPAAGARVTFGIFSAVCDSQGQYSLEGFDSQEYTLLVKPPQGADYLMIWKETAASTDMRPQNFALERGSVITGRLREKETGKPLRVPYVDIMYQSERSTDLVCHGRTKPDGSFRIVVPPGKGKLTTYDSVPGCVPRDLLGDAGSFPEPVSEAIEIKPGETLTGNDFLFLKGMTVQGRVLDEEGKPVVGAIFQGVTEQAPSGADGAFTLRGLSPEHNSIFHVVHAQRGLGVKITIPPSKDSNPVQADVQLQPTLSATARVVDENMQPVASAQVSLLANITMKDNGQHSSFRPVPVYGVQTDSAGAYTLPTLVVGGSYAVGASAKGYASVEAYFKVEAGQKPQILDLVLPGNRLALAGVVVDAAGNPIKGVEVWIQSRNQIVANSTRSMNTKSDGRFHFSGLIKSEYRLRATIWKPTGQKRQDGSPDHKAVAEKEIRVEAGKEDIRITLDVSKE